MNTHGHLLIRVGVVASTCMAASRHLHSTATPTEPACGRERNNPRNNPLGACLAGDAFVTEAHLVDPFAIAFATMLVMNAPTILLTHTRKLEGVKFLCATGLVLLGGLGIAQYTSTHVSKVAAFVWSIHCTTTWLHAQRTPDRHVYLSCAGECVHALFRWGGVLTLLAYAACYGPPVVVTPGHPGGISEACGLTAHLLGVLCTDSVLLCMGHVARGVLSSYPT